MQNIFALLNMVANNLLAVAAGKGRAISDMQHDDPIVSGSVEAALQFAGQSGAALPPHRSYGVAGLALAQIMADMAMQQAVPDAATPAAKPARRK